MKESYLNENFDLSNFIKHKPIAIFIEIKDCATCQQIYREAFVSKDNYKVLSTWHVIQTDSEESGRETSFPSGISQKVKILLRIWEWISFQELFYMVWEKLKKHATKLEACKKVIAKTFFGGLEHSIRRWFSWGIWFWRQKMPPNHKRINNFLKHN